MHVSVPITCSISPACRVVVSGRGGTNYEQLMAAAGKHYCRTFTTRGSVPYEIMKRSIDFLRYEPPASAPHATIIVSSELPDECSQAFNFITPVVLQFSFWAFAVVKLFPSMCDLNRQIAKSHLLAIHNSFPTSMSDQLTYSYITYSSTTIWQ